MAAQSESKTSGAVCPRYLMYQSSKRYSSAGEYPTICVTEKFVIAVSAGYYRSGTLFCTLGTLDGKKIAWTEAKKLELDGKCSFPSVAATSEGTVILAYVRNKRSCYYTVGSISDDEIEWSHSALIDDGKSPSISVCVGEDSTITVVIAFVSAAERGYTRVGTLELRSRAIRWSGEKHEILPYCSTPNFKEVSIAISPNKDIAIAYRLGVWRICCQHGKVTNAGNDKYIDFNSTDNDLSRGNFPSVSINKQGHVLMFFQSFAG